MSHNAPGQPPKRATACPGAGPQAGPIDPSEGRIIDPVTHQPVHQQNTVNPPPYEIDPAEPECDAKPMHEQRQNPPPVYPANGNPVPTEAQRNAPRPPSFNSDLQKLIIMGYSRDRAENALIAADFNLSLALRKLQGR